MDKTNQTSGEHSGPDFAKLPLRLLREKALSFGAKCLYARLGLYAGKDGVCNPSHETLARELGISTRSIRALLTELREYGLVTWQRTQGASRYRLKLPEQCRCPDRNNASDQNGSKPPIGSETKLRSDGRKSSDKKMSLERGSSGNVSSKEEKPDYDCPPRNSKKRDSAVDLGLLANYPNLRSALREHLQETDTGQPSKHKVIRIIQATGYAPEPEIIEALRHLRERGYGADHIRTYKYFEIALADHFRQKREHEEAAQPCGQDEWSDRNEARLNRQKLDELSDSF